MTRIEGKYLTKVYKNGSYALKNCSLSIKGGEFLVIVGASGSGKSTLLKVLAGTEPLSSGELYFDGILSDNLRVQKRGVSMVFQEYLLYPHMTVFDNLATPLKLTGEDEKSIYDRVMDALRLFDLEICADVKPKHLSGGEQQRVALAKAIIRRSKLVLLDEPLSNVDEKSRREYCEALKRTKKLLPDSTFVYVTHNPTEAFYLADRIAVMKDGAILQIGTKDFIKNHPVHPDVLALLALDGDCRPSLASKELRLSAHLDGSFLTLAGQEIKLTNDYLSRLTRAVENPVALLLVDKLRKTAFGSCLSLVCRVIENGGDYVSLETQDTVFMMNRKTDLKPGEKIRLYYRPDDLVLYNGEERLTCHYPLHRNLEIKPLGTDTISLLGKRIRLKKPLPRGARHLRITDGAFRLSYSKDSHPLAVNGCLDEEFINGLKLCHLDLGGSDSYLSFFCDPDVTAFGKERVWLNIYPEKFEFT